MDRERAEAALAVLQSEIHRSPLTPSASAVTVRELWEAWKCAHVNLAALPTEEWRSTHLLLAFASRSGSALGAADLDAYRAARSQTVTKRGHPPTVATINRELVLLQRVLNFGVSRRMIPLNPIHGYRLERENNAGEVVVTEQGIEIILRRIGHAAARAWTIVAFESGMRRSEVWNLCWRQLDWKSGLIEVPGTHTKSKRPRIVEFPARSQAELAALPRLIGQPRVFVNVATGQPYHARWLYKLFVRAVLGSGVVGINGRRPTWHDLRRSYITLMRRRGVQESVVMLFSGHSSRDVFDRYNIVVPDELRPAIEKNASGRARELAALRPNRQGPKRAEQKNVADQCVPMRQK